MIFSILVCNYDQPPHDMGRVELQLLDSSLGYSDECCLVCCSSSCTRALWCPSCWPAWWPYRQIRLYRQPDYDENDDLLSGGRPCHSDYLRPVRQAVRHVLRLSRAVPEGSAGKPQPACAEAAAADKTFCPSCGAPLPEQTAAVWTACWTRSTADEAQTTADST